MFNSNIIIISIAKRKLNLYSFETDNRDRTTITIAAFNKIDATHIYADIINEEDINCDFTAKCIGEVYITDNI